MCDLGVRDSRTVFYIKCLYPHHNPKLLDLCNVGENICDANTDF